MNFKKINDDELNRIMGKIDAEIASNTDGQQQSIDKDKGTQAYYQIFDELYTETFLKKIGTFTPYNANNQKKNLMLYIKKIIFNINRILLRFVFKEINEYNKNLLTLHYLSRAQMEALEEQNELLKKEIELLRNK